MKTQIALTTLALLASPAWAMHWDSTPDMAQSILNTHAAHVPHVAGDSHGAERGRGDYYGSILLDVGKEAHVPHRPGDSHAPEKGKGDSYGSVLIE